MTEYLLAVHPAIEGFGSHDPSAVLFADDDPVFGIEEERLNREKHAPSTFPDRSIRACLDHRRIGFADVDRVVVPWRPRDPGAVAGIERALARVDTPVPPVVTYDHHRSHAASAFYPSGFEEALVLTIDGRGSRDSTVVWHATGEGIERVRRYAAPNSLGYLYAVLTGYLGYRVFGGEGRTMALAAYGEANPAIESTLQSVLDTGVEYDVTDLVGGGIPSGIARLEGLFDRERARPAEPSDLWAADLAFTVQTILEETVVAIAERYCRQLGTSTVCLAGGVALNCKLNKRLGESPAVEQLFVQPIAGDAGAPLGAGLLVTGGCGGMQSVFLDPSFSRAEVERLLTRRGIDYEEPADPASEIATRLADGAVVGQFRGRTEMGPRALGNRSVLADPRSTRSRARVNAFVKHREPWRPFAPSILAEAAADYLDSPRGAPYMIRAFDSTERARKRVPAVLHPADGTARPQLVDREHAPEFHRLLAAFGDLTGVPVLLNSSFNDGGEPIVNTPDEALAAATAMDLDCLLIEGFLVQR